MTTDSKPSASCSICCEDFTNLTRARIVCPSCKLEQCRKCIRTYLLNTSEQAHCMGCKHAWNRKFLIDATLNSYVNGDYKDHRANLLLEQEKARLPETMPAVENYKNITNIKKELVSDNLELEQLETQINKLKSTIHDKKRKVKLYKHGKTDSTEKKRAFKQKCGVENCLGFLSTSWKCGVCESWTCPHCLEVLGKDKNCGHQCDPNNVESAKLIKKETRNCPACATPIYKINGCDQMWCTQCHIAFSWKTGMRVNGVIHNPHFYQWQNQGGQPAQIQTPGAQVCGGIPNLWGFSRQLKEAITFDRYKGNELTEAVLQLHRGCAHLQHYEIDNLRLACQNARDNTHLRIRYLCKEITEQKFKQSLQTIDKRLEKKNEILQVYELINTVFLENINDIQQLLLETVGKDKYERKHDIEQCCRRNIVRCHKVRIYGNKELSKISSIYNQKVGLLTKSFRWTNVKILANEDIAGSTQGFLETPHLW